MENTVDRYGQHRHKGHGDIGEEKPAIHGSGFKREQAKITGGMGIPGMPGMF